MLTTRLNNPFLTEYDWKWVSVAEGLRSLSKDPYRKVGCALVKDGELVSSGFNKLPFDTIGDTFRLRNQSTKNLSIIHAEVAAINNAAREGFSVFGSTAFITCHPCGSCASILIDVGIKRVVCPGFSQSYSGKWRESFQLASDDLYAANIPVLYYGHL
jgi:dCMP deaminase